MFGVDVLRSCAETTCDSLTPSYVSQLSVRTYGFLVVTTRSKPNSGKRLRCGGAFVLSPCRARSCRFPPQTWARGGQPDQGTRRRARRHNHSYIIIAHHEN